MKLRLIICAILAISMSPVFAGSSFSKQPHKIAPKNTLENRAKKINAFEPLDKVQFFEFFDSKDLSDQQIEYAINRTLINLYREQEGYGGNVGVVLHPQVERQVIKNYSHLKPLLYAVLFQVSPEQNLQANSLPTDLTEELNKLK